MEEENAREVLVKYLTSQEWENIGVVEIAGNLHVTIRSDHYHALKVAALALAGSLTAYGDYEIVDRTAMQPPKSEIWPP
jgi:hypothetical protein